MPSPISWSGKHLDPPVPPLVVFLNLDHQLLSSSCHLNFFQLVFISGMLWLDDPWRAPSGITACTLVLFSWDVDLLHNALMLLPTWWSLSASKIVLRPPPLLFFARWSLFFPFPELSMKKIRVFSFQLNFQIFLSTFFQECFLKSFLLFI